VVIRAKSDPKSTETAKNELVMNGTDYYTQFSAASFPSTFTPTVAAERYVIYGVDSGNLRMPFNRADYYIARPTTNMSPSCAPNTGILYKATVRQTDGTSDAMPVMDCVADMQVIFRRDTNGDGVADATTADISALSAQQIRETVKEVRVYVLAQEGQRDRSYSQITSTVTVGEFGQGSVFDLSATIGTGWQNYRWKVYTLVIKPKQLQ
jgi:hypothetical protein